jgi:DNA-binding transcriptional LysR family regulator
LFVLFTHLIYDGSDNFVNEKCIAGELDGVYQMRDIETRLLRYFVALAEEQLFARAAERLGITPPTLTHQMKKLESDLGARLFQRKSNRRTVVNDAGQQFLADAREALLYVEKAAANARQAGRGELGRLQLGFMTVVSSSDLLRSWIGPFEEANPAIDVTTRKLSPMAQIAGIMRKELDAGFARAPHKYPTGVRGFEIYRQSLVLALPAEHPLARRKTISPAMLTRETFVNTTPELDIGFFGYTEPIASIGNFIPRVVKRESDFNTVLSYVARNRGIAVGPGLMKTISIPNVVFRNIAADPVPQTSIAFVYSADPSPSTKLLIRHMQRHALRNHGRGGPPPPVRTAS